MDELTRKIEAARHHVQAEWDGDHAALVMVGLRRRARRRTIARAAVIASVVAGALAGITEFSHRATEEVSATPIAMPAPPPKQELLREVAPPQLVRLGDGSTLAPLTADSKIVLEQIAPDRIEVAFDAGQGRFDVLPNPKRSFVVTSGEVRIIVLGTAFTLERVQDRTRIAVDRGRARVEWSGGARDVGAGEAAWFPPQKTGPSRPQLGRDRQAVDLTQELLMAADAARLAGRPEDAAPLLRQIVDRYPRDPRAPLAAFTLGRVLLELGRSREAAAAFAQARQLDPDGSLAEDARRREVESRSLDHAIY